MTIRLVIANDHFLSRKAIVEFVTWLMPDVEIVGSVGDVQALFEAVEQRGPDIALIDSRMVITHLDGLVAAKQIRHDYPRVGVVAWSHWVSCDHVYYLIEDDAKSFGYVSPHFDHEDLPHYLPHVANGGTWIDPWAVDEAIERAEATSGSPLGGLTPIERDVLRLITRGGTNPPTSRALDLSAAAAEEHVGEVFAKLGLAEESDPSRRAGAVLTRLRDLAAATSSSVTTMTAGAADTPAPGADPDGSD